jgi:hypothetical protein
MLRRGTELSRRCWSLGRPSSACCGGVDDSSDHRVARDLPAVCLDHHASAARKPPRHERVECRDLMHVDVKWSAASGSCSRPSPAVSQKNQVASVITEETARWSSLVRESVPRNYQGTRVK